jgi:hypothetical protein
MSFRANVPKAVVAHLRTDLTTRIDAINAAESQELKCPNDDVIFASRVIDDPTDLPAVFVANRRSPVEPWESPIDHVEVNFEVILVSIEMKGDEAADQQAEYYAEALKDSLDAMDASTAGAYVIRATDHDFARYPAGVERYLRQTQVFAVAKQLRARTLI